MAKKSQKDIYIDTNLPRLSSRYELLALNRYVWKNLPDGIESHKIEEYLYESGQVFFFIDSTYGTLCLKCSPTGMLNVYGEPLSVNCTGVGYSKIVKTEEGVRIKANDTLKADKIEVRNYVTKMLELEWLEKSNARLCHRPYVIKTNQDNMLSVKNMIKQIDEEDCILLDESWGSLNGETESGIKIENINVPFLIDKITQQRKVYEGELMEILGLNNNNEQYKKERLVVAEINVNNHLISAYLELGLKTRKEACEKINEKFGYNIEVDLNDSYKEVNLDGKVHTGTENNIERPEL